MEENECLGIQLSIVRRFVLTPVDLGQGEVERPCEGLVGRLEFQCNGKSF